MKKNTWYRNINGAIACFQDGNVGYGISTEGEWGRSILMSFLDTWDEMSSDDVQQELLSFAEKNKGFVSGTVFTCLHANSPRATGLEINFSIEGSLTSGGGVIMKDGTWAGILSTAKPFSETPWINVKDYLPEDDQEILGFDEFIYKGTYRNNEWIDDCIDEPAGAYHKWPNTTHWTPLINPPEK